MLVIGIIALATAAHSTLLAMPGRQLGHVQLVHLPPCRPPAPVGPPPSIPTQRPPPAPTKHPVAIIVAHTTALTRLAVPPSGRLLATASSRGTLVRVWDAHSGKLMREFRRGSDKAEIYGIAFRPDERELCVWSDKGTIHVFAITSGTGGSSSNRQSTFSPLAPFLPLPKYFESEWSYAQYRLPTQSAHIALSQTSIRTPGKDPDVPDEERCVVGWIEAPSRQPGAELEHQLLALTWTGGWYRLGLPASHDSRVTPAASSSPLAGTSSTPGSPGIPGRTPLGSTPMPPPSVTSLAKSGVKRAKSISGTVLSGGRSEKGKERERENKEGSDCVLEEFRRFGRWDGWA
jgi:WD repeat-containing protein 45